MKKNKILIVEDEKDTRFILNKLLTKNDFIVEVAENGKDALEKIKSFHPEVIIADWMMPVMDGLELCDVVKKDEELKIIYYIILTARGSLRDKIKGLDVGADDFLLKPIENQELLARIRAGVRIFNLQNELREIEHSKAVVEMACTIGHELNNPLSSLVISIHNLEDELKSVKKSGNFDEDFKVIDESIERIKSLATHLRNLNNPEVIDYTHLNKMIKINKK